MPILDQTVRSGEVRTITVKAPVAGNNRTGRVLLQATDGGGLSSQTAFNVIVLPVPAITDARFSNGRLVINGSEFGTSGALVTINGQNVSADNRSNRYGANPERQ